MQEWDRWLITIKTTWLIKTNLRFGNKIVWADEQRIPLAQEEADEYDLINKVNVEDIIIHHHIESSQLKSVLTPNKQKIPFGPKYTGEGKLDFYSQNNPPQPESRKEDMNEFEGDISIQSNGMNPAHRAKFVPVSHTK